MCFIHYYINTYYESDNDVGAVQCRWEIWCDCLFDTDEYYNNSACLRLPELWMDSLISLSLSAFVVDDNGGAICIVYQIKSHIISLIYT